MSFWSGISATKVSMAFRCGEQYRRRYVEGERRPPGIAMARGTGVHAANKANLKQKIQSQVDLPLDAMKDACRDGYVGSFRDGIYLTREERSAKKRLLNEGLEDSLICTSVYAKEVAPLIVPVSVEEKFTVQIPELEENLIGVMDMEAQNRIDDLKSTSKKWPEGKILTEIQSVFYSFVHQYVTKKQAKFFYHILISRRGKDNRPTSSEYQVQEMMATEQQYSALIHKILAFQKMLKAGVFLPAEPGSWGCSEQFCGYWTDCRYVGNAFITKYF